MIASLGKVVLLGAGVATLHFLMRGHFHVDDMTTGAYSDQADYGIVTQRPVRALVAVAVPVLPTPLVTASSTTLRAASEYASLDSASKPADTFSEAIGVIPAAVSARDAAGSSDGESDPQTSISLDSHAASKPKDTTILPQQHSGSDQIADSYPIHVCFCWGEEKTHASSWRPLLVAVNSTLVNTKRRDRLVFHIITKQVTVDPMKAMFAKYLPHANVQLHFSERVERHIDKFVSFRSSSGARKELSSPFNFAPFYLDAFLGIQPGTKSAPESGYQRLIYLDTDVVLLGDIQDLHSIDLHGHALAAVEDCSQRFELYIDFKVLTDLGLKREGTDKDACVFNRGVFLLDVEKWHELELTADIETYMKAYKTSKKDLYRFGMSQPPWLLAIRGRYQKLGVWWNCRGLGREQLSAKEFQDLQASHLNLLTAEPKGKPLRLKRVGSFFKPYVSTCSWNARLLHFNGRLKPWKRTNWQKDYEPPMCLSADRSTVVKCVNIWKRYIAAAVEKEMS